MIAALVAAFWCLSGPASAETKSALSLEELEQALIDAGLDPEMTSDAKTGAPVAKAEFGSLIFWIRALDCDRDGCSTLMLFSNFDLDRPITADDLRTINRYNDSNVFGRAYALEKRGEVGVDYVIELDGGVSLENVTRNISRWADVMAAFIENFQEGPPALDDSEEDALIGS
ncbi:MAG: YbjN domain-containing protein [Pseudomonadota bacterium]